MNKQIKLVIIGGIIIILISSFFFPSKDYVEYEYNLTITTG